MEARRPRTRSDVARKYGHPWPWKVEELLRDAFERQDGDLRTLAREFNCDSRTVEKWAYRFNIRGSGD